MSRELQDAFDRNLALYNQGRYEEALRFAKEALRLSEREFGDNHMHFASSLENLAVLYHARGQYAEAQPLFKRGLAIFEIFLSLGTLEGGAELLLTDKEKSLGAHHPDVATSLENYYLAALYDARGRYAKAEPLYKRALAIREKDLGPNHPQLAPSLSNLALLRYKQGRYPEAEPLYRRALEIQEKSLGPDHPDVGQSLNGLAQVFHGQDRYAEAEPLYKRALAIREKALGPNHPDISQSLNNLGTLYDDHGRYAEAEPLHKRALAITLISYATYLRSMHRADQAESLEALAAAIRAKQAE